MKRLLLTLLLFFAMSILAAGNAAIIASGNDCPITVDLTVDLYTQFEKNKGNEVLRLYDYHIPKGVTTLYIIAHGWNSMENGSTGFVYVDLDDISHYMNYATYFPYLEKHTDVERVVINACLSGSAVKVAEEMHASFDVYASCAENEVEYGLKNRPLYFAKKYVEGSIPEIIYTICAPEESMYNHPQIYTAEHGRRPKDETKPPYL